MTLCHEATVDVAAHARASDVDRSLRRAWPTWSSATGSAPGRRSSRSAITRTIEGILGDVHPRGRHGRRQGQRRDRRRRADDPGHAAHQHRRDRRAPGVRDAGRPRAGMTALQHAVVAQHPSLPAADRCRVMGILNVTPDSFSDGGRFVCRRQAAVAHGLGARARPVPTSSTSGGESTRPGAARVPVEDELRRVVPVVRELTGAGIAVSIDTMWVPRRGGGPRGRRRASSTTSRAAWPTPPCCAFLAAGGRASASSCTGAPTAAVMSEPRRVRRRAPSRTSVPSSPGAAMPPLAAGVALGNGSYSTPASASPRTAAHSWALLGGAAPGCPAWASRCWSAPRASASSPSASTYEASRPRPSQRTVTTCRPRSSPSRRRPAPGASGCTTCRERSPGPPSPHGSGRGRRREGACHAPAPGHPGAPALPRPLRGAADGPHRGGGRRPPATGEHGHRHRVARRRASRRRSS